MSTWLFRRVLGSLRPANKAAEEALAAVSDGPVRVRITRTTGNVRRNALYWSCLSIAAPMLSERIEGDALNAEMVHRILKDRYGLVRVITLPSGDTKDYDSTSFAKMPEHDRAKFIHRSLDTLSKWLGVASEELSEEAHAA
ncbi:hypothetical protein AB5I41_31365 [Sphingomonas sp. MMS24-JH45]